MFNYGRCLWMCVGFGDAEGVFPVENGAHRRLPRQGAEDLKRTWVWLASASKGIVVLVIEFAISKWFEIFSRLVARV